MTSTLIIHNGGKLVERAISSDLSPVTLQEYLDNYDIPPGELRLWHNGDQVPHDTTPLIPGEQYEIFVRKRGKSATAASGETPSKKLSKDNDDEYANVLKTVDTAYNLFTKASASHEHKMFGMSLVKRITKLPLADGLRYKAIGVFYAPLKDKQEMDAAMAKLEDLEERACKLEQAKEMKKVLWASTYCSDSGSLVQHRTPRVRFLVS